MPTSRTTNRSRRIEATAALDPAPSAALPALLLSPAIYPHPVAVPTLVETHASWVVLAGPFAYKFKRPVRYPFLDYSTPDRRRAACEAELALNRRWAPMLYLDVVELAVTSDGPRLGVPGGHGEPALRMHRFAAGEQLDALLTAEQVAPAELAAFGRALADVQAAAPVATAASALGRPATVRAALEATLATLAEADEVLGAGRRHSLAAWADAEFPLLEPLLAARRASGRVRDCHGDLHAGNVVRLDGRLVPFDGIEFSAELRTIDCAADAAFLAMDLEHHGRADLAAAFLDAWLERSGDAGAAGVLRWFLVDRALVRAKVAMLSARLATPAATGAAWDRARAYVATAERFATRPPGLVVITSGLSGSGKSRLAAELVGRLPAVRLRSDVERKRLAGLPPEARSGSPAGAGLYTAALTRRTYARLASCAGPLARAGLSVLLDATYLEARERERVAATARAALAPFAILACEAPLELLCARLGARQGDPSEATLAVLERQLAAAEPLTAVERRHALHVDTSAPVDASAVASALRAAAAPPAG
ncbi:MAG: AAA family ATPase [Proteobacteria bacterium]|nr:AAA family ATPase [Pseudomonadota bacterium]